MSDEEKEAIERLIEIREFSNLSCYKDIKIKQLNAIDVILNLIEKQAKEIEELKKENKRLRKCHLQYEEMTGIDLLLPSKEEQNNE